jgi:tRNA(Ile)-lysidine synthase
VLPLSSFSGHRGLARRLVRRVIEVVKGDLRAIDFAHIERILEIAVSPGGHDRLQIPGLEICRSFEWVRFAPAKNEPSESASFSISLPVPGSVELPGTRKRITLQVLEKEAATGECAKVVDELDWHRFCAGRSVPSLELRNWRAGDQYRRVGHSKPEKIKFFFQEARIPLWERGNWPIITYNDSIVWTRRFGAAAEFATGPETRSVLQVTETDNELRNRSDRL